MTSIFVESLLKANFTDCMIYLDNNATTKIDPRVLDAMMPFLTSEYGNAASNHEFGVEINQHVKAARTKVSQLIGSEDNEIVFTSGATEAINLALIGLARTAKEKKHIVTCKTEHHAVLDTCVFLEKQGFEVSYLSVDANGLVDLNEVKNTVREDTLIVCIMIVNNETGVIQPIKEISDIAHEKGAYFMTDGTQAVGKIPVDVNGLGIDLMSFSGHKFYGPKGVGALYIRSRRPNKVKLEVLIYGGGHEKGLRSGTLNVPGIVGMGKAAEIAKAEMSRDEKQIGQLRDELENSLLEIEGASVNGAASNRLYNVSSICFQDVDADAIMIGIKPIIVSNGSACTSAKIEPSHVLKAMGLNDEQAYATVRFSLGRFNTKENIKRTIIGINEAINSLRSMV